MLADYYSNGGGGGGGFYGGGGGGETNGGGGGSSFLGMHCHFGGWTVGGNREIPNIAATSSQVYPGNNVSVGTTADESDGGDGFVHLTVRNWDPSGVCGICDGIVANWPLSSGEPGQDFGPSNIHGVPHNLDSTTISSLGGIGSVFRASHNHLEYIDVSNFSTKVEVSGDFTISFLALPHAAHEVDNATGLDGYVGQKFAVGPLTPTTNHTTASIGVSVGTNGVAVYALNSSAFALCVFAVEHINDWSLITVVVRNNRPFIYINGHLAAAGDASQAILPIHFRPAALGGSGHGAYEGWLASVTVYDRALDAGQVRGLHTARHQLQSGQSEPCPEFLSGLQPASAIHTAPTHMTGVVTGYMTMRATGSPYYLTDNLIIASTGTLVIEAGVEVIPASDVVITVFGVLHAVGTPQAPIVFMPPAEVRGFVGCFGMSRSPLDSYTDFATLTPDACMDYCHNRGFTFAYLNNGYFCRCDNGYIAADSSTECTTPCRGKTSVTCGGRSAYNVYRTGQRRHFGGFRFPRIFRGHGTSVLVNVVVSHAGGGDRRSIVESIRIEGRLPVIENVSVSWSSGDAIHHTGTTAPGHPWVVRGLTVMHIRGSGVYFEGDSCYDGCSFLDLIIDNAIGHGIYLVNFQHVSVNLERFSVTNSAQSPSYRAVYISGTSNMGIITVRDVTIARNSLSIDALHIANVHTVFVDRFKVIDNLDGNPNRGYAMFVGNIGWHASLTNGTVARNMDNALWISGTRGRKMKIEVRDVLFAHNSEGDYLVYIPSAQQQPPSDADRVGLNFTGNTFLNNTLRDGREQMIYIDRSCCTANGMDLEFSYNMFLNNSVPSAALLWFLTENNPNRAAWIRHNTFQHNKAGSSVMLADTGATGTMPQRVLVNYNRFFDDGVALDVREADRNSPVDCRYNYYGTDNEFTIIEDKITDALDDPTKERAEYFPFLLNASHDSAVDFSAPRLSFISADGTLRGLITGHVVLGGSKVHVLSGHLLVHEDATLTIQPGADIRIMPGQSIDVKGTLIARGKSSEPITIRNMPFSAADHMLYVGCVAETGSSYPRDWSLEREHFADAQNLTVESCVAFCRERGCPFAAPNAYWGQCACGTRWDRYSGSFYTNCNRACTGNVSQRCGDQTRSSVYQTGNAPSWGQIVFEAMALPTKRNATTGEYISGSILEHVDLSRGGAGWVAALEIKSDAVELNAVR